MLYDVRRVEFALLIARNERLFPLEEECEYEEYESFFLFIKKK